MQQQLNVKGGGGVPSVFSYLTTRWQYLAFYQPQCVHHYRIIEMLATLQK